MDRELTDNASKSRRIATNSVLLFVRMLAITVINLYAVRLLLRALGQEDYGTFNAVAGVVLASAFINTTLAICIQRFYSYTMGEGRHEKLSDIFSASMNIIVASSLLLFIIFETAGTWFVYNMMSIPPDRLDAAYMVFQFSIGALCLGLLQLPYTAAIFAHEEMGIFALVSLSECLLRLVVVLLITAVPYDGLVFYGAGLFAVSIIIFILYSVIARHRYSECRYHRHVSKDMYKSLLSFSGWTMYSALAAVGTTQGVTVLLYMFFGPVATAAYAISQQVLHAFQTLSNSVVVAFRPAMVKSYAEKNYDFLNKMFAANNKFILYLLLIVAIPLLLELRTIFGWWLGDVSEQTITFTRLIIIYMVCFCMHNPVTTIVQSTGEVKHYSLCVDSIMLLCVPLCWLVFHLGAPSWSGIVLLIAVCLMAHVVRLIILRRVYPEFRYTPYLCGFVVPALSVAACTSVASYFVSHALTPGLLRVVIVFAVSAVSLVLSVYAIGLSKEERQIIRKRLRL